MKILKANNPKPGTTPIVVALSDLSNAKLRDNFNYDTMDGTMQRYKTYLKGGVFHPLFYCLIFIDGKLYKGETKT